MNTLNKANEEIIVGLDIGTTKICVIVAKKVENNKLEILGSGEVPSRGVQDGEVKNIRDTAEDIRHAVEKAEQKTGIKIHNVFVGIAGAHIKSKIFNLGVTRNNYNTLIDYDDIKLLEDQVRSLNHSAGEKMISFRPQEFFVDNEVPINNNPIGVKGNRLEAKWHVITGNENSSINIEQSVKLAQLIVTDIDLEPLASAAAVLTKEQMEEGVCLLDIGGGTTDMAIFSEGLIRHTAIIPLAGEYMTKVIQRNLNISANAAKRLKESNKVTNALYQHLSKDKNFSIISIPGQKPITFEQRYYCQIINACLDKIFSLVNTEITASGFRKKLNAGIVITGGGAMIPHLKDFVEQCTGIHTQIGLPISRLSNLQDKSYVQTRYATGIGLALLAADRYNNKTTNVIVQDKEEEIKSAISQLDIIEDKPKSFTLFNRLKKSFSDMLLDETPIDFDK